MKKEIKTFIISILLSTPGVIVLFIGALMGKSSTQLADLIRKSLELIALIASFIIFLITINRHLEKNEETKLNSFVNVIIACSMFVSGIMIVIVSILNLHKERGNVTLSLIISILGVMTNGYLYFKYRKFSKENDSFHSLQELYKAKTIIDFVVSLSLLIMTLFKEMFFINYVDLCGCLIVVGYLVYTGIHLIIKKV